MTVFILTINNYPCRDCTLTEAFSSMDKAVNRMRNIYEHTRLNELIYRDFMHENQGCYSCGWIHANKGQYETYGIITEQPIQ